MKKTPYKTYKETQPWDKKTNTFAGRDEQEEITRIKKLVRSSKKADKANRMRYAQWQYMIYVTSISARAMGVLNETQKPLIEVNQMQAYIDRQLGEFYKQDVDVYIGSENGANVDQKVIEVVEGHLRHIIDEAKQSGVNFEVMKNQLSGGFDYFKVYTDYAHSMSMDQVIKIGKVYDPTCAGIDMLSIKPSGEDARFCFEEYPISLEDFNNDYSDNKIDKNDPCFYDLDDECKWFDNVNEEKVVVVRDFYEKRKEIRTIVKISDGRVMFIEDYKQLKKDWDLTGQITQIPAIVSQRDTDVGYVVMTRLMGKKILDCVRTPMKFIPLAMASGNSVCIKWSDDGMSNHSQRFTKPFVYSVKGIQDLVNFTVQSIGNDLENKVQQKWVLSEQAMPKNKLYQESYTRPELASVILYNEFLPDNPEVRVTPPREVMSQPLDGQMLGLFMNSGSMFQTILGAYDAQLGATGNNPMSGVAITAGSLNSSATTQPYMASYIFAFTQVCRNIVDIMPYYYKTPMSIPVLNKDGTKGYQRINDPNDPQSIDFNYDSNFLNIKVKPSTSFALQKAATLALIKDLCQASPLFAEFINTKGLEVILDNIEMRGIEELKKLAEQFMQQKSQEQQIAMVKAQKEAENDPTLLLAEVESKKGANRLIKDLMDNENEKIDLAIKQSHADTDRIKAIAEISNKSAMTEIAKAEHTEQLLRNAVNTSLDVANMSHAHAMDVNSQSAQSNSMPEPNVDKQQSQETQQ